MAYTRYTSRAIESASSMPFSITEGLHFHVQVVTGHDVDVADPKADQGEQDVNCVSHCELQRYGRIKIS